VDEGVFDDFFTESEFGLVDLQRHLERVLADQDISCQLTVELVGDGSCLGVLGSTQLLKRLEGLHHFCVFFT